MLASAAMMLVLAAAAPPPATMADLAAGPVEGREVVLRFERDAAPAAGVAVRARYRENAIAAIAHEQEVGVTGEDGTLVWVPEDAGVVVLSWEGGSRNVSVLHAGIPPLGVVIAVIAGILLLGGSVFSFFRLRAEEADFDVPELPKPET